MRKATILLVFGSLVGAYGAHPALSQIARVVYPAIRDLKFVDESRGWLAGYAGLFYTANGGRTWARQDLELAASDKEMTPYGPIGSIADADTKSVVVVGKDGFVTWSLAGGLLGIAKPRVTHKGGTLAGVSRFSFAGQRVGWAQLAGLYRTTDSGATWAFIASAFQPDLRPSFSPQGMLALSESEVWVVGNGGWALHTTDGGASWLAVRLPVSTLFGAWFRDAMNGMVFGSYYPGDDEDKGAFRTTDGGKTWSQILLPVDTRTEVRACSFIGAEGWAVGGCGYKRPNGEWIDAALIMHSWDDGQNWEVQMAGPGDPLRGIVALSPGHALAFDHNGGLLLTEDHGGRWERVALPVRKAKGGR